MFSKISHLFLSVSGDASPLVLLNTVSPEVSQVLCAIPAPKQVHSLCREQTTIAQHVDDLQLYCTKHLPSMSILFWKVLPAANNIRVLSHSSTQDKKSHTQAVSVNHRLYMNGRWTTFICISSLCHHPKHFQCSTGSYQNHPQAPQLQEAFLYHLALFVNMPYFIKLSKLTDQT